MRREGGTGRGGEGVRVGRRERGTGRVCVCVYVNSYFLHVCEYVRVCCMYVHERI